MVLNNVESVCFWRNECYLLTGHACHFGNFCRPTLDPPHLYNLGRRAIHCDFIGGSPGVKSDALGTF